MTESQLRKSSDKKFLDIVCHCKKVLETVVVRLTAAVQDLAHFDMEVSVPPRRGPFPTHQAGLETVNQQVLKTCSITDI